MSAPWMKFYPSDWRADPALRMCSVAARGLWMEMLCVMHEAQPYGSLRVNGKPISVAQLASLAGSSRDEVEGLLGELEAAGVFSHEDGAIVSRRMQRDKAKADEDRDNGKRGGNPGLRGGVNPPDKGQDKAQIPEARYQKSEQKEPRDARSLEFETFWSRYPNKVGKPKAIASFAKARRVASLDAIMAGLDRYIASKPPDREWPNPTTFLNQERWNDQPAAPPVRAGPQSAKVTTLDVGRMLMREMERTNAGTETEIGGHQQAPRLLSAG